MAPVRRNAIDGPEADAVVLWRTGRLEEAGFAPELAEALARDCAYDLHAVLGLVDRGCPPRAGGPHTRSPRSRRTTVLTGTSARVAAPRMPTPGPPTAGATRRD